MSGLGNFVNDPNYESQASAASKLSEATFILTFVFLLLFLDNKAGFLSGAVFFFVGIFVVSIVISAPSFLLKKKFRKASLLISLFDIVFTIFITTMVFSYFFTNPLDFASKQENLSSEYVIDCDQPVPEFTLAGNAVPTKKQKKEVCGCVWSNLPEWAKESSSAISDGRHGSMSEIKIRTFISEFGSTVRSCNTEGL